MVHWETGISFHIRFGKFSKGRNSPTSGSYLSSQREGRETGPIYYCSPVPSPKETHIQKREQRCPWSQPEARKLGPLLK